MKSLNSNHIHAAKLHFQGATAAAIAEAVGVGVRTIEGWIKEAAFLSEVERLRGEQQQRDRSELDDAAVFQAEVREKTRELYNTVYERILGAIAALDDAGISRTLPPLVKAARDATELVLATDAETLGLEQLAKELDGH